MTKPVDDLVLTIGLVLIGAGLYEVYHPLAPIFVGVILIALALGMNPPKPPPVEPER